MLPLIVLYLFWIFGIIVSHLIDASKLDAVPAIGFKFWVNVILQGVIGVAVVFVFNKVGATNWLFGIAVAAIAFMSFWGIQWLQKKKRI